MVGGVIRGLDGSVEQIECTCSVKLRVDGGAGEDGGRGSGGSGSASRSSCPGIAQHDRVETSFSVGARPGSGGVWR